MDGVQYSWEEELLYGSVFRQMAPPTQPLETSRNGNTRGHGNLYVKLLIIGITVSCMERWVEGSSFTQGDRTGSSVLK